MPLLLIAPQVPDLWKIIKKKAVTLIRHIFFYITEVLVFMKSLSTVLALLLASEIDTNQLAVISQNLLSVTP